MFIYDVYASCLLDNNCDCVLTSECIDIISSQPGTYFVIKMYSIVFIAKLEFFHSAALAAIFRVTI